MESSFSKEKLKSWANDQVEFIDLDMSRISTAVIYQIYDLLQKGIFSPDDIVSTIRVLEGLQVSNGTPEETLFRHPPLKGLYKRHFPSPRFMAKNLFNFHRSKKGHRHFKQAWEEAVNKSDSEYVDDKFIGHITHQSVIGALQEKMASEDYTGEWVVFHKHQGLNYYLTLASHEEAKVSPEAIYKRALLACEMDKMPFVL